MPAVTSRWCHGAPRVLRTSRSGIAACDVVTRVDATRCDVQRCTGRAAKSQTIVAMFRRQRLPGRPPTPNVFLAGRPRRRAQRCPFAALIHIARLALASRLATMRRTPLRRVAISADDHGAWPRLQLVRLILCRKRLVAPPRAFAQRVAQGIVEDLLSACIFATCHATSPAFRVFRSALAPRNDAARACALCRDAKEARAARPTRQLSVPLSAAAIRCRPCAVDRVIVLARVAFRTVAVRDCAPCAPLVIVLEPCHIARFCALLVLVL